MPGLYFHIPFCRRRCHYCDFYFTTNASLIERFLVGLEMEIFHKAPLFENELIETIYFGGGTPSLLSLSQIERVLALCFTHFRIARAPEITLEANPEDLNEEKLQALASSPVNRLSLGVQSFDAEKLKRLSRVHSAQESFEITSLTRTFFRNINIDLMFGTPNESLSDWQRELEMALQFQPEHLSTYSLTVEPKTLLAHDIGLGKIPAPSESLQVEMFLSAMQRLREAGYRHYEVSNFAKPASLSTHNFDAWQRKPYLGFGPAAHSFVRQGQSERRFANARNLKTYLENPRNALLFEEKLTEKDILNEEIFLALRQDTGLDMDVLEKRRKFTASNSLEQEIDDFYKQGLLRHDSGKLRLTDKGFTLADSIAETFMAE